MSSNEGMLKPRIGFLGLGHMGTPMARRLLDAGYALTVFNHTTKRAEQFAPGRAGVAKTPREAAEQSDVLILMLSDDTVVRKALLGEQGALDGLPRGAAVIDMSTVSPEVNRSMAKEARGRGVAILDAPVSGSVPQAEQGSLVIFAGGERAAFERCEPILKVMGQRVFYMGPSGSGNAMKLVVNTLLGVEMQAIAEAVALGEKAGLDRGTLLATLGQTAVIAPGHKAKLENAAKSSYPPAFALGMMRKDFGLILEHATRLAVPMPATAASAQINETESASREGADEDEDYSVVVRLMERMAGLQPAVR